MKKNYFKTYEEFINEENSTTDTDSKKDKPDYSDLNPIAAKIMKALNKAGFKITEKDIVKWKSDNDNGGELTVKIDDKDMFFFVEKGILYYQMDVQKVMLGMLNKTSDLSNNIKDYFNIKTDAEKKKDKEEKDKEETNNDTGVDDLKADLGNDSLGL